MIRAELLERIRKAAEAEPLDRTAAVEAAELLEREPDAILEPLLEAGQHCGIRGHGREITVSRNVFIPLTNLCRNRCAYCTFAKGPRAEVARTYAIDEVRALVVDGLRSGCSEALFCLGDKPEIAYRAYKRWLGEQGYRSTPHYLVDACRVAFEQGMFPHSNAGIMTRDELSALRPWNASMGLMLETTSRRLRERGQAHYYAPDKDPAKRIAMTRAAGELRIPFTSGILVGIGETPQERIDALFAIDTIHRDLGHIQEVIVQNFHAWPGTPWQDREPPSEGLMAGTVALARLILGPDMNVQAPPNLSPTSLELLVRSGLNDWGGVSPLTIDHINPEAPWPALRDLELRTQAAGYGLRERLCAYPRDIAGRPEYFDPPMLVALRAVCDAAGYPLRQLV